MSDSIQGDEMNADRLSSFLLKNGGLKPVRLTSIQEHVVYIETNEGERLILKRHNNKLRVEQQWHFFEQQSSSIPVSFQRFPNQKQFLYDNGRYWTISPYIHGRKLNYVFAKDRKDALNVLKMFHNDTKGVKIRHPLIKEMFYVKWHKRLQKFMYTEPIFKEYRFNPLFTDIVQTAEKYLQLVSAFNWGELHDKARQLGTWIHGDVAAHNFIRSSGQIHLIDFDLLSCAPPLNDYIQIGQRYLPYLNWDLDRLLSYKIVPQKTIKPWLYSIFIPSDVMREWLYFLDSNSERPIRNYLEELEMDWLKRQYFLKTARKMLN
ncbi:phosphotransferase [Lentibacillus sp. CBA3610]|uniref:phosphotransferase n=1 Tax=Lentibacillus sp. CBA3610 TaxID=2518176 RepID=UPI00159596D1|nr:phosphotransferase [Lentibacillus sp. CBA3610]QKY69570.1 hypothetical protein Len3610_08130 [Lentibacillus sp. CBA3610]